MTKEGRIIKFIKFIKDAELEVTESYDEEADFAETHTETFRAGESVEADVFDDRGDSVNVQFGDGSVVYGLPKSLIEMT